MVNRKPNGDGKLFSFPLPPLPEDLPLPPLPVIHDKILYQRATTHTSLYAVARITNDLDTANYVQINDYEKMEFMGDRLLGVCADIVVDEMYPNMRQGVATMIHDRLVCNDTLAQLADKYGVTEQIQTSADAQHIKQQIVKLRGSAFEAWVAGVYYDRLAGRGDQGGLKISTGYPLLQTDVAQAHGTAPLSLPAHSPASYTGSGGDADDPPSDSSLHLRGLFASGPASPTWRNTTVFDGTARLHGEAIDYLLTWLRPMCLPIIGFALTELRKYQEELERDRPKAKKAPGKVSKVIPDVEFVKEEERLSGGAVNALFLFAKNQHDVEPTWSDKRSGPGVWRMTCELQLPDGRKFIRQADKPTKKLAKAMAALYVCQAVGIMKKGENEGGAVTTAAITVGSRGGDQRSKRTK